MGKRALNKYKKEYEALVNKYMKLMIHHSTSIMLRFINDIEKLNQELEKNGKR